MYVHHGTVTTAELNKSFQKKSDILLINGRFFFRSFWNISNVCYLSRSVNISLQKIFHFVMFFASYFSPYSYECKHSHSYTVITLWEDYGIVCEHTSIK